MYEVHYSEHVTDAIREFARRNAGRKAELLAALREFDRRLQVYPQFGQPLWDLSARPVRQWIGVVPPLVFYYLLNEDERLVLVARPPRPLPRTGLV